MIKNKISKQVIGSWSKEYQRDEENRIIINMNVKDDTEFLSVFSESETPVIGSETAEFLESSTFSVSPHESLTLRIKSSCIDDGEKVVYEKAIKEYYKERYVANEKALKRFRILSLFLALIGVAILASAIFLEYQKGSLVWAEVVDIAAWVFLWEAVDIHFFKSREMKLKRKRYLSFISAKIEFIRV